MAWKAALIAPRGFDGQSQGLALDHALQYGPGNREIGLAAVPSGNRPVDDHLRVQHAVERLAAAEAVGGDRLLVPPGSPPRISTTRTRPKSFTLFRLPFHRVGGQLEQPVSGRLPPGESAEVEAQDHVVRRRPPSDEPEPSRSLPHAPIVEVHVRCARGRSCCPERPSPLGRKSPDRARAGGRARPRPRRGRRSAASTRSTFR